MFSVLLFCSHEVAHVPQAVEIPATRPPLVVLVFAFATLSVNRIALRETGREIEMYPSASKLFGFCCCDCTGFCANLQKREIIQLPLSSPRIRARLGESIGECIVVVEAWRDPRPPGGRRHLHWQLVSAHSVIGTHSRPSTETQRVEMKAPSEACRRPTEFCSRDVV